MNAGFGLPEPHTLGTGCDEGTAGAVRDTADDPQGISGAACRAASADAGEGGEQEEPTGGANCPGGADEEGAASAVSLLQELIQGCSSFSPHARILTWAFEQQLEEDTTLRFCATVSFAFGGHVLHSFCGSWQSSKKKAQRDTAERVRRYLLRRLQRVGDRGAAHAAIDPANLPEEVVRDLWEACDDRASCGTCASGAATALGRGSEWRFEDRGPKWQERFRAILTFHARGMPHHFAGSWCPSEGAARRDAAERVLWYFGRSSEVFAAAAGAPSASAGKPSLSQFNLASSQDSQQAVEDKTVLMRVQNALQKAFARETPAGQRVWVWSYEPSDRDPQLFRARVDVPCWQRSFLGDWCRGKKLAQRSACLAVKRHLDRLPASAS
mmetsp:Transcript_66674/g.210905  ORF Transcript_66674/g.210905 Transcript_66674/m.210905 type:complete len:383 (+) Transcript_66674:24-1172(+)